MTIKVGLTRNAKETLHTSEACVRIEALAEGVGESAYIVVQSFRKICFEKWTGAWPVAFDLVFAGRIFGPSAEIRWVREGDSCTIWNIREAADGELFERTSEARRYYLWGRSKDGKFREERITGRLDYPVPPPRDDDREYVGVFEYYHAKPAAWPNPDSAEQALNRPRIAAHRLATVGCDRDL